MCKMFSYLVVLGLISAAYSDGLCGTSSKYEKYDCIPSSTCGSKSAHQTCGIDSSTGTLKVCCPRKSRRSVRSTSKKDAYAIAKEKCDEYSEARYVMQKIPSAVPVKPDGQKRTLECPVTKPSILQGEKAKLKEFPHMAMIGLSDNPKDPVNETRWDCGGTLISDRFVLTSAHCEKSGKNVATWVRLGELKVDDDSDSAEPKDFRIAERIVHPKFKTSSAYFDIMLLKLKDKVSFTPHMRPICLDSFKILDRSLLNESIIAGWGRTAPDEIQSDILLKGNVYFADNNECISYYKGDIKFVNGFDATSMICAGNKLHGNDCYANSGAPLKVPIPDERCMYLQLGISSFGPFLCGQKDTSSIYTEIWPYIPWIQSIVWP